MVLVNERVHVQAGERLTIELAELGDCMPARQIIFAFTVTL